MGNERVPLIEQIRNGDYKQLNELCAAVEEAAALEMPYADLDRYPPRLVQNFVEFTIARLAMQAGCYNSRLESMDSYITHPRARELMDSVLPEPES